MIRLLSETVIGLFRSCRLCSTVMWKRMVMDIG